MDIKNPTHLAYVATLPCETLVPAKQALNDKLQGSVAAYLTLFSPRALLGLRKLFYIKFRLVCRRTNSVKALQDQTSTKKLRKKLGVRPVFFLGGGPDLSPQWLRPWYQSIYSRLKRDHSPKEEQNRLPVISIINDRSPRHTIRYLLTVTGHRSS